MTENGTPYDFDKAVTSSFSLKAVYWPSNAFMEEKDASKYDSKIKALQDEVECLFNILTNFYSNDKLINKSRDVADIFGVKDGGSAGDVIRTIVANAKMDKDHITVKGEKESLSNTSTTIHLSDDKHKTIESNNSQKTEYSTPKELCII